MLKKCYNVRKTKNTAADLMKRTSTDNVQQNDQVSRSQSVESIDKETSIDDQKVQRHKGQGTHLRESMIPGQGRHLRESMLPGQGRHLRESMLPGQGRHLHESMFSGQGRHLRESMIFFLEHRVVIEDSLLLPKKATMRGKRRQWSYPYFLFNVLWIFKLQYLSNLDQRMCLL